MIYEPLVISNAGFAGGGPVNALEQAAMQGSMLIFGSGALALVVLFANLAALFPRQRDEAPVTVGGGGESRDWVAIVRELTLHVFEGRGAMDKWGRPEGDPDRVLEFMVEEWYPAVLRTLEQCPEYLADFYDDPRTIWMGGGPVPTLQLDGQIARIRGIIAEIRLHHL